MVEGFEIQQKPSRHPKNLTNLELYSNTQLNGNMLH